jgi:hypothetical protein
MNAHSRRATVKEDLREAGELASAEGLADPRQAVIVRTGTDGAPVTDGVFPESKEFLAGYWIIDVETEKRAHEIAARAAIARYQTAAGKTASIPERNYLLTQASRERGLSMNSMAPPMYAGDFRFRNTAVSGANP